ncbi:Uncharacterised protein [Chlamydia trachomatis]|nr:Uncharacterised protein [Chlamydia trachomatis]
MRIYINSLKGMKEALFYMIITHSNIAFIMKRKALCGYHLIPHTKSIVPYLL